MYAVVEQRSDQDGALRRGPDHASTDRLTTKTATIQLLVQEIPHLRRFARSLARDPEIADDLVQDCIVRAISKLDQWQAGTMLRAWLIVILRNLFLNKIRSQKFESRFFVSTERLSEASTPARQEDSLVLKETQEALNALTQTHRDTLLLVAVKGLSYEEAASIACVSIGTIKSRVSRARAALRAQIKMRHPSGMHKRGIHPDAGFSCDFSDSHGYLS